MVVIAVCSHETLQDKDARLDVLRHNCLISPPSFLYVQLEQSGRIQKEGEIVFHQIIVVDSAVDKRNSTFQLPLICDGYKLLSGSHMQLAVTEIRIFHVVFLLARRM